MSFGLWIRDKLLEAGDTGVTVADLHKQRIEQSKETGGLVDTGIYKGGTYHSFARYFHWFKQLGFVESVRTEPSETKGNGLSLRSDRHYYRITDKGRRAHWLQWNDPIQAMHPEWTPSERKRRYSQPTGRPRGRPRKVLD